MLFLAPLSSFFGIVATVTAVAVCTSQQRIQGFEYLVNTVATGDPHINAKIPFSPDAHYYFGPSNIELELGFDGPSSHAAAAEAHSITNGIKDAT